MVNIFLYESKGLIKSVIIWGLSIFSIIFFMMLFFPAFSADADVVEKIMANYPEALLKAFGMSSGLSMASVLGYFSFTFAFTQLFLAIQAANYGFSVLSIEEREFTADFLLSKPVSRVTIFLGKFAAVTVALLITNVITWLSTFFSIELFKSDKLYDKDALMVLLISAFLFQMLFMVLGMVISVALKRVRNVLAFSMAISFGTYILNAVRSVVGGDALGYVSPFYYFDAGYIFEHGALSPGIPVIVMGIIIICIGTTIRLYSKRDIHSL